MKIAAQLRLLTLVNSTCLLLVIALTAFQLNTLRETFNSYEHSQAMMYRLAEIKAAVLTVSRADLMSPTTDKLLVDTDAVVRKGWAEIQPQLLPAERDKTAQTVVANWDSYLKNFQNALKISSTNPQDALSIPDQIYNMHLQPLSAAIDELSASQQVVAGAKKVEIEADIGRLLWVVLTPLLFAGVVIVGFQSRFGYRLRLRVAAMSEVAVQLRQGDLSRRLPADNGDEISDLARAINDFVAALEGILRDVQGSAKTVRNNAQGISGKAHLVTDKTREQSEDLQEVSGSVDQIREAINEVSANVSSVADSTFSAAELGRDAALIGRDTTERLAQLDTTVADAAGRIRELVESIAQIGEVSAFIKEIAGQTNLLALNAAIEAARAGEQGRGFAVVADEVRKLSENTTRSTVRITELLDGVHAAASETERTISHAREAASAGVGKGQEMAGMLRQIDDVVAGISDSMQQIAAATEEQSAATHLIGSNIEVVTGIAEETMQSMMATDADISLLVDVADQMEKAVSRFHLSAA